MAHRRRYSACMDTVVGLRLFIRVVETGSFSKASADLGITQPTATKAVAAMEQRLGARLLHRTTRGVSPTEVEEVLHGSGLVAECAGFGVEHATLGQAVHAVVTAPDIAADKTDAALVEIGVPSCWILDGGDCCIRC